MHVCNHEFRVCVLSNAPCGTALRCDKCSLNVCGMCPGLVPVFAKHCLSGLKRSHFCHFAEAGGNGCNGGSAESSLHLRAKAAIRDLILSRQGSSVTVKENFCAKGEKEGWSGHFARRSLSIPHGTTVVLELRFDGVQPDVLVTLPNGTRYAFEIKKTHWTTKNRMCTWWELDAEEVLQGTKELNCIRWRNPTFGKTCMTCQGYFERKALEREREELERVAALERHRLSKLEAERERERMREELERRHREESVLRLAREAVLAEQEKEAKEALRRSIDKKRSLRGEAILHNLSSKTVSQLKELCKKNFLRPTGRREDLLERLTTYAHRFSTSI